MRPVICPTGVSITWLNKHIKYLNHFGLALDDQRLEISFSLKLESRKGN